MLPAALLAAAATAAAERPSLPPAYSASSDVHFQMPGLGGGYIAEHRWADAARASELTVDVLDGGPASSVELHFQTPAATAALTWDPATGKTTCRAEPAAPPAPNAINASSVQLAPAVEVNGKRCSEWRLALRPFDAKQSVECRRFVEVTSGADVYENCSLVDAAPPHAFVAFYSSANYTAFAAAPPPPELFRLPAGAPCGDSPSATGRRVWQPPPAALRRAAPPKPSLNVDFMGTAAQTQVQVDRGATETSRSVSLLALDSTKLLEASSDRSDTMKNTTTVLMMREGRQLQIEPFFQETVCFNMSLPLPAGVTPKHAFAERVQDLFGANFSNASFAGHDADTGLQMWSVNITAEFVSQAVNVSFEDSTVFFLKDSLCHKVVKTNSETFTFASPGRSSDGSSLGAAETTTMVKSQVATTVFSELSATAPPSAFVPPHGVQCVPM